MSIGENIRNRRKAIGMNAETLAAKIGCSPVTIYRYENGAIEKVSTPILEQIAIALNTSPAYLMGWERDYSNEIVTSWVEDVPLLQPQPDYDRAATAAYDILLKHKIKAVPVSPLTILQQIPGVFVVSFTEYADRSGVDDNRLVRIYDSENQDVIVFKTETDNVSYYYVAYNQRLPYYMLQRAMARELGHICLKHDETISEEVRTAEALCFMRHLLCPRPLIKALDEANVSLTVETIGSITGLYGRSIAGMRETPGAHIPARMNRRIREQFSGYVDSFLTYQSIIANKADATLADFGTYMDNYQE